MAPERPARTNHPVPAVLVAGVVAVGFAVAHKVRGDADSVGNALREDVCVCVQEEKRSKQPPSHPCVYMYLKRSLWTQSRAFIVAEPSRSSGLPDLPRIGKQVVVAQDEPGLNPLVPGAFASPALAD